MSSSQPAVHLGEARLLLNPELNALTPTAPRHLSPPRQFLRPSLLQVKLDESICFWPSGPLPETLDELSIWAQAGDGLTGRPRMSFDRMLEFQRDRIVFQSVLKPEKFTATFSKIEERDLRRFRVKLARNLFRLPSPEAPSDESIISFSGKIWRVGRGDAERVRVFQCDTSEMTEPASSRNRTLSRCHSPHQPAHWRWPRM